ncbi:hypothetical protein M3172_20690 [Mesobacillus subterraneus]|uniref:hypothetical protein n=1 Tax=Mesobacillus subterraneus TaxID=285983 RepID=UPI00203F7AB7|nr:hypothetical protein [Mesobacillus subterraneus]MCM3575614.1 hypothetical protein [Mesobacillus subterraneus]
MGFFDKFFKQASKTVAKGIVNEMGKTPQQKEIEKLERELGVKLDPNSYQTFTEAEYQEHIRKREMEEDLALERLSDLAFSIVQRVWHYQDDYMQGNMLKGDFNRQLEVGYEDLKREVVSSSSSIDPDGYLSLADKMAIYERNKKHLDYLKHTWLPNN